MRCAVHGDSVNCPPFCTSQLAGTASAGEPGGPARNTEEFDPSTTSESRTAASEVRTSDASKARDIALAFGDVGTARDAIRRARIELTDLSSAIEYISGRLDDCDALLKKYDNATTPPTTA